MVRIWRKRLRPTRGAGVANRQPRTVIDYAYASTHSLRAAYKVGLLVEEWRRCRLELGDRRPMVSEFATWSHVSEQQVYKRLAEFRRVFPGQDGPDAIAAYLNERVKADRDGAARVAFDLSAIVSVGRPEARPSLRGS